MRQAVIKAGRGREVEAKRVSHFGKYAKAHKLSDITFEDGSKRVVAKTKAGGYAVKSVPNTAKQERAIHRGGARVIKGRGVGRGKEVRGKPIAKKGNT